MKKVILSFSILLFTSMCLWAQNVPQTIDYQGRLTDSDGNYLNGVVTVDFLIYNVETGGTALWSETQDVSMSNGIFHVLLGSVSPFPPDLFDGADCWLELVVGGETLSPRTQIASVPFSIKAETAYSVEVPLNLTGNVSSPNSVIKGENTGIGYGVYGSGYYGHGYLGSDYYGVYGENSSSGNYGYLGSSSYGVYGNGAIYGGYFEADNIGVYGIVNSTGSSSSSYYGVRGAVSGGSGFNYGINGEASGSGNNYGIRGSAGGSGTNYGIYVIAAGGSTNYAGYFNGDVHYTGTLTGPSDERFKENVQPFKNALSKIKLMNVHTFNFKQMEEKQLVLPEGKQIGLIAQELEEILPELVKDEVHAYDKNEGVEGAESDVETIEYKGINYIGLIPVLIEAIKELQTINEEQQRQIDELLRSAGN